MASDGGMKITCSVNLHGLEQDLKEVGPKIGRRLFRKALKSVGQLWVEDLKFRVPVDEGDLRESIAASVTVRNKGKLTVGAVTCGPSYDKTSPRHGSGRTAPTRRFLTMTARSRSRTCRKVATTCR